MFNCHRQSEAVLLRTSVNESAKNRLIVGGFMLLFERADQTSAHLEAGGN